MRRTTISHSREAFIPNQGQYASWANPEPSIMDQTQDLGDRLTEIGCRDILPHGLFRIHRLMQDGEIGINAMLIDRGGFFCRRERWYGRKARNAWRAVRRRQAPCPSQSDDPFVPRR